MDRYLTQETWGVGEAECEYEQRALSHDLKQQKSKKVGLNAESLRLPLGQKQEGLWGRGVSKHF